MTLRYGPEHAHSILIYNIQVQSGELFASIDYEEANSKAGDATVTFLPDPEPYNSSKTVDLLTSKMSASAALGERNIDLSLRMLHDKAFLKKVRVHTLLLKCCLFGR